LYKEGKQYSENILKGLTASVSHFHGVEYIKNELFQNGFIEIKEQ
jgi:aspartyl aminopeptidase